MSPKSKEILIHLAYWITIVASVAQSVIDKLSQ